MRILGIDPGLATTGYGLIESAGNRFYHIAHGEIKSSSRTPIEQRLKGILSQLQLVITRFRPDCMALEDVFVGPNPRSALALGQARGVALSAGILAELPISSHSALRVKKSLTGVGRADKQQVAFMVQRLLHHEGNLPADAADALAIAICQALHQSPYGSSDRAATKVAARVGETL